MEKRDDSGGTREMVGRRNFEPCNDLGYYLKKNVESLWEKITKVEKQERKGTENIREWKGESYNSGKYEEQNTKAMRKIEI